MYFNNNHLQMTNTELISMLDKDILYKHFCDKYEDMYDFSMFSRIYDDNICIRRYKGNVYIDFKNDLWDLVRENMIYNGIKPNKCECSSYYGSEYVTECWESFDAHEEDYLTMEHLEYIFC